MDVKAKELNKSIKTFWTTQHKAGHRGLVMLNDAMLHFAEHGDWTPLARFLALSGKEKASLFKIVKCAFGTDNVSSKVDKKSEFGFRLVKGWEGNGFDLATRNGYGVIRDAIENNKSFRSADFLKQVNETVGTVKKPAADKSALEALEVVYKYITGKVKDNQDLKAELTQVMQDLEKRIEVRKKAAEAELSF
jgi:hypothetical protein